MKHASARVGFLGLGMMGEPMARRLVDAGYELVVWNRTATKCQALANAGARVAATPAEAVESADHVFTCLLDTQAMEQVMFAEAGVVHGIRSGACVFDLSTVDPQWALRTHARLRAAVNAEWIDAPVSGGVPGATEGSLVMFCGGREDLIDAARPVLSVLAARITRFGAVGCGLAAKLCNQTIVANQLVAIAEAMNLAARAGIDLRILVDALQGGFADSTLLRIFGPRFAMRIEEPRMGQIGTMLETLDMARALGSGIGLRMPASAASAGVYRAVGEAGQAGRDLSALMGFYGACVVD